jgi:cysteinyl-tRNA synthetase, unknown class
MNFFSRSTRTWMCCIMMTASFGLGCGSGSSLPDGDFGTTDTSVAATATKVEGSETEGADVMARRIKRSPSPTTSPSPSPSPTPVTTPWSGVKNFGCQLQDLSYTMLQSSPFDMLVMDYSVYGDSYSKFTPAQVNALKNNGARKVVAYLSVGEAEDYRYYWQTSWRVGSPYWLGAANDAWGGNYKVKYWTPEWKAILWGNSTAYLDQLLAAGYDGVFLDVVDAYEYWESKGVTNARAEMANLVLQLSAYARQKNGQQFGVFLNGGEELIANTTVLNTITGLAKEQIFYGYDGVDTRSPADFTAYQKLKMQPAVNAGKLVLSIDYAATPAYRTDARSQAAQAGYREYVSSTELLNNLEPQW